MADWRERWNHPDPDHVLPKLNKRDSVVFFSSVLDLYGRLVNGYDRMLRPRDGGDYGGCTLRNMFDIDAFLRGSNRYVQPFLKEFVTTQLFSNLIRSRIECSTLTSTSLSLLDFPILFFDKYLMLMSQPSQARVNHLYRVLFAALSLHLGERRAGCDESRSLAVLRGGVVAIVPLDCDVRERFGVEAHGTGVLWWYCSHTP